MDARFLLLKNRNMYILYLRSNLKIIREGRIISYPLPQEIFNEVVFNADILHE